MSFSSVNTDKGSLEALLKRYADDFASKNHAARTVIRGLSLIGIGLRPVLDHIVFRAHDAQERAREFVALGYEKNTAIRLLHAKNTHLKIYQKKGFPAILIEQPSSASGQEWLKTFGEANPYYLAVRVEGLADAVFSLEKQGIAFVRPEAGGKEDSLRQIAAAPEVQDHKTATTLVLVERHAGEEAFYAPDFWVNA